MTTKYQIDRWGGPTITAVKVISETDKTYLEECPGHPGFDGKPTTRRNSKHCNPTLYGTWSEAHSALLERIRKAITHHEQQIERDSKRLAVAENLIDPGL